MGSAVGGGGLDPQNRRFPARPAPGDNDKFLDRTRSPIEKPMLGREGAPERTTKTQGSWADLGAVAAVWKVLFILGRTAAIARETDSKAPKPRF